MGSDQNADRASPPHSGAALATADLTILTPVTRAVAECARIGQHGAAVPAECGYTCSYPLGVVVPNRHAGLGSIREFTVNKNQLITLWIVGSVLILLFMFPPWLVGWQLQRETHETICFARIWTGPSGLLKRASQDELQAAHAEWEQARQEYDTANVWEERYGPRQQSQEASPSHPGRAPIVSRVTLTSPGSVSTRLSLSRLILECVAVLIVGGLAFISLRSRRESVAGADTPN